MPIIIEVMYIEYLIKGIWSHDFERSHLQSTNHIMGKTKLCATLRI